MEFNENHFYKLTKEIPKKQIFEMPSLYHNAYYDIYGNSNYYSYTISTCNSNGNRIISHVSPYESSSRFTIGRIYQAASKTSLYDDMNYRCSLDENEIECFEEAEIGLNNISKKFIEKHIASSKMEFKFTFFGNNLVVLRISLNGKYNTWVTLMGVMGQINEMLHNAYIELRKSYAKKLKRDISVSSNWAKIMRGGNYICDIETSGVFGGRL